MGADLHDKCSCGRIKKSYLKKCHHCRMGVATEVPVVHHRPKTQPQSDTLSNCEGCGVQIGKKKRFCKGCLRRNGLPQERMNSHDHLDQRWKSKSNSSQGNEGGKGKFVCDVCGKQHIGGNIAKGAQKAVGGSIMGIFGTLTMLTGGLTAPLMLGAATAGAALYGAAENYSTCSECRNK